jgi:hypothetical protein
MYIIVHEKVIPTEEAQNFAVFCAGTAQAFWDSKKEDRQKLKTWGDRV